MFQKSFLGNFGLDTFMPISPVITSSERGLKTNLVKVIAQQTQHLTFEMFTFIENNLFLK